MCMNKVSDSFYFYDDFALDENIRSKFAHRLTFVDNLQRFLPLEFYVSGGQFLCQGIPINRFQLSGARVPMVLNRSAYNRSGQILI